VYGRVPFRHTWLRLCLFHVLSADAQPLPNQQSYTSWTSGKERVRFEGEVQDPKVKSTSSLTRFLFAGKFSLAELYKRAGFTKEVISRGKYAELNADNRSFTPDEEDYFAKSAMHAYKTFRDKAALSRGLPVSFSNTAPLYIAKQGIWATSLQRASLRWPLGRTAFEPFDTMSGNAIMCND
jgi:hypothetical protein